MTPPRITENARFFAHLSARERQFLVALVAWEHAMQHLDLDQARNCGRMSIALALTCHEKKLLMGKFDPDGEVIDIEWDHT